MPNLNFVINSNPEHLVEKGTTGFPSSKPYYFPMKTTYFILLALSLSAVLWNRKRLPPRIVVFIPLIALTLVQFLLSQFGDLDESSLWIVIHGYHFIAFPLFISYLLRSLKNTNWKKVFLASIPVFYVGGLLLYQLNPDYWTTPYLPELQFTGLMIVIGSILIFFQFYHSEEMIHLSRQPDFWIGIGNLTYYAGFTLSMGFYWYILNIIKDEEFAKLMIHLSQVLNLFLYFTYTIAFLCIRKKANS